MKTRLELPVVRECLVSECAYNRELICHAQVITVGDAAHPACDTFVASARRGRSDARAGVGACMVSACRYNSDLCCRASTIAVGYHGVHADCMTFTPG